MKTFFAEFRKFINKGNVLDLAVAVIIGGAFQSIVNSLVSDMFMPLLSLVTGGIDFSSWTIPLGDGPDAAQFAYGNFIAAVINFILMALVVFLIVKALNKAKSLTEKPTAPAAPTTKKCPYCKSEISIEATRCPFCTSLLDVDVPASTHAAK